MRAVVSRVNDDGVVGDAHVIQRLENRAYGFIVLDHAVVVFAVAVRVAPAMFGPHMRPQMHPRAVPPTEEWLVAGVLTFHEVDRGGGGFIVNGLHPFLGQRTGVFDSLLADRAEPRIDRGIIFAGGFAFQHTARAEFLHVFRVLRIIGQFGFFLGVEVIKVSEELIKAVDSGQAFVAVTDMVLTKLPGRVAETFHDSPNGRVELAHAHRCTRESYLGEAGAYDVLAGKERRAPGGAGLLTVILQEANPFLANSIDVRRLIPEQAITVSADVGDADVVTPDDKDVRFARRWPGRSELLCLRKGTCGYSEKKNRRYKRGYGDGV